MNPNEMESIATRLLHTTAAEAAAARLLSDARLHAQLVQWLPDLELWRTDTRAAVDLPGRRYGFVFSAPAAEIVVTVPDDFSSALTAIMAAAEWPESLRIACVERLLEASAQPLAAWLKRHSFALSRLDPDAESPGSAERLHGLLGVAHLCAELRCTDRTWPERALTASALQRAGPLASVAALPVALTVAFGHRRMAMTLLRTLAAGDVLVLPSGTGPAGDIEHALLVPGQQGALRLGLACQVRGAQLTIQGDHWMSEQNTINMAAGRAEPPVPGGDPLADIEVDLRMELQVISTPIGELSNMRTGYVLELPVAVQDACVDLVVGGQLFGRAQLVCVGDRLGVRIIELRHDAS